MEPTLATVKEYFGQLVPVTPKEMKDFWQSLTLEEKDFYKNGCAALMSAQ
jgi:hypothetical protein